MWYFVNFFTGKVYQDSDQEEKQIVFRRIDLDQLMNSRQISRSLEASNSDRTSRFDSLLSICFTSIIKGLVHIETKIGPVILNVNGSINKDCHIITALI